MEQDKVDGTPIPVKVGEIIDVYGELFRCVSATKAVGHPPQVEFRALVEEITVQKPGVFAP